MIISVTGNASMCNPWDKAKFLEKMKSVAGDICNYCLPDCNGTIYETTVSSAPFQSCDHTNLESASMCKMSGSEFNPPPWLNDIKTQYRGMYILFFFSDILLELCSKINFDLCHLYRVL